MPIYEYECLSCAHRFDEIQKFSDPPKETCPVCSAKVRKLLFPAAVIFKGSGFYATEYGKSKQNNTSSETKSEAKSEAKTEAKTETKTETKAETKPATADKPSS